tara:strand:- start:858 stop:1103 length:246 start_codon:yes stop_codon:yes gene_type:complete
MDKNIHINTNENVNIDYITLQKMAFLFNALENGWTIRKNKDKYIFIKKHEGEKEIMLDSYLRRFIKDNFDINKFDFNSNTN